MSCGGGIIYWCFFVACDVTTVVVVSPLLPRSLGMGCCHIGADGGGAISGGIALVRVSVGFVLVCGGVGGVSSCGTTGVFVLWWCYLSFVVYVVVVCTCIGEGEEAAMVAVLVAVLVVLLSFFSGDGDQRPNG